MKEEQRNWESDLNFLLTTMPLSDRANYPVEMFESFVTHGRFLREQVAWCRELPEEMYRHYVLYHRVNDEEIADCRRLFYEKIWPLVEGKSLEEAILAVNYWCASEVTYRSTDDRTASPLTVLRCGFGRCGEESVFTVNALRSVGIPARQVYVPKWAHCDDNHAWVEVYCDGAWHYLGACEPEEMLDRGWFMAAASRAMLVHSRTFGEPVTGEELISREGGVFLYNQLARYADTIRLTVMIRENGVPLPGVEVRVELLNYAQFTPIATLHTDAGGQATLTTGKGDLYLHCVKGDRFLRRKVELGSLEDRRAEMQVELDFAAATEAEAEAPDGIDFVMQPPRDNIGFIQGQPEAVRLRRQEKYDRAVALRHAKESRLARADSYESRMVGCYGKDVEALFATLTTKDHYDCPEAVLEEVLEAALPWKGTYPQEIFEKYLLCPRIGLESQTCWRRELRDAFSQEAQAAFREAPTAILGWIREHISYEPEREYDALITTPAALMRSRSGSPKSQDILFVAICRSLEIPARLAPEAGRPQYWDGAEQCFRTAEAGGHSGDDSLPGMSGNQARFTLTTVESESWNYYQNWTLGRLVRGQYETLNLSEMVWENGQLELQLMPGAYRLLACRRMPTGTLFAREYRFRVPEERADGMCRSNLEIRNVSTRLTDLLSDKPLPDMTLYEEDGSPVSLADVTAGHASLLLWLEAAGEPTEHILNEMEERLAEYRRLPARIVFVLKSPTDRQDPRIARALDHLPGIRVLYDDFRNNQAMLARRMYIDPEKLPMVVLCREGLTALYGSAGYNVGLGELILRIFREMGSTK